MKLKKEIKLLVAADGGAASGKTTAQGKVDIFPKSSPLIKLAILPRNSPIGATQQIISVNLKKFFFENINVATITPNAPP